MRDNTHPTRDQSPSLEFPRRAFTVLFVGAAAYAVYRMIQTVLFGARFPDPEVSPIDRIVVSAADGTLMALSAPLAFWASRKFPLVPVPPFRNVVAHLVIAFAAAAGWIVALDAVYSLVTNTPRTTVLVPANLSWLTSNLFAYSLLVALVHLMAFQERVRQTELHAALLQSQLSTARLETLKAQLHPHFLFNTLHTISELIHIDPNAADAMVIRLGRLLRLSLEYTADSEVALDREVEVVAAYLDLHRMRYGDRLTTAIDIEPAVCDALVPPMILQPLVENSLRHGLNRRSTAGHIWISARRVDDRLRLSVMDDGVGLSAQVTEGVGLGNTRTRLNQHYAAHHRFVIEPRQGGGTVAVIEIPLRFASHRLETLKVRPVYAEGHEADVAPTM